MERRVHSEAAASPQVSEGRSRLESSRLPTTVVGSDYEAMHHSVAKQANRRRCPRADWIRERACVRFISTLAFAPKRTRTASNDGASRGDRLLDDLHF